MTVPRNPDLERDEDFIEDCRQAGKEEAAERGVLPYYQRRNPPTGKCRACAVRLGMEDLTEDGLCADCDAEVKRLERGKI